MNGKLSHLSPAVLLTALALSVLLPLRLPAQQIERDLEQMLDEYEPDEEGAEPEDQVRLIFDLAENPLNINRADAGELMRVPGMTWTLASAIVDYRTRVKPFASTDELIRVRGIGQVRRGRFQPYLTAGSPQELRRDVWLHPRTWTHNGRSELYSRYRQDLDLPEGYQRPDSLGGYIGSPANLYQRYRYHSDHLSINYTQTKHPGEPMEAPFRAGSSFHLTVHDLGRLRTAVLGDFGVRFGQGLILGNTGIFGKGTDVIRSASPGGSPLRGLASAGSPHDFRGMAISYGGRFEITGFVSSRRLTASVIEADTIRYPAANPRFRTRNERDRRFNTSRKTAGGRLAFRLPAGLIGASGYVTRFSRPIQRGTQPWQRHDFQRREQSALSIDYRFEAGPTQLFGEAGRTGNGGMGVISGLETSAGEGTEFALLYRYYEAEFQSVFGNSFAEQSSGPQNEEGWYLGVRQRLGELFRLSAYIDQYAFPAPRFRTRRPSEGTDGLMMLEYRPDRDTEVHLLVRQKIREQEYEAVDELGRTTRPLSDHRRVSARLHFTHQVLPRVRLRSRIEWVQVRPPGQQTEQGLLLWQDLRVQAAHNLQIDARITLFETESFETRFYHYENDLLYVFSSRMLFDQGQRLYLLINYDVSQKVRIWLKISGTWYEDRNEIGSGLNRLPQSFRREVGIQTRIRL